MKQIPNLITLVNLLCGCAALLSLFQGWYFATAGWLAAAALADFADGLAARVLNVSSPVGKELDSLADLISFGLVPGAILYTLLVLGAHPDFATPMQGGIHWFAFPGFILTGASALRLARFNLDERQTEGFIGLATPACTILVLGLLMLYRAEAPFFLEIIEQRFVIYALIFVLSWLLLAEIPMFSFKFKQLRWEGNALRIIFAASALVFLLIWREVALAPIVLIYIIINIVRHFTTNRV
ncbi:CDP-alcohol phosphatidyltransferase family protein [Lewinella cohaerens]|uniref:CDP-alcohol phosphatidyltransferase family protein n=1 Tax=Lewinella cohaerens TaxID=70995 RepID=UPI00035D4EA7|nr:CDP-alcohol phosphatidyltransferase family protein [Lewinella cohaerens]